MQTLFQQLQSCMVSVAYDASQEEIQEGMVWLNAAAIWVVLPLTLMYVFGQRFFIECIDRSGIKE